MLKNRIHNIILILLFTYPFVNASAIHPIDTLNKKRLYSVIALETGTIASSLYLLNNLWYKDYPRTSFHIFNDNKDWMQMDKIGHASTSCTIGSIGYYSLKWSGVENKKAIWFGGGLGSAYLLTIEILDGLSSEWGFSMGDFAANTMGSLFFMSQQLVWNDQRCIIKWSFHQTKFSHYRPDLLGNNFKENMLKDYNGQTYWLSGNIASFLKKDTKFPKWLNIAVGYGAEGMIGGHENLPIYNGVEMPVFKRYRQFYISPDIDLTRINTNSTLLKTFFRIINFIKIPAPAFEISKQNKFAFKFLYF